MKFDKFNAKKALSLANLLSADDLELAKALSASDYYYLSYLNDPVLNSQNHIKSEIGAASYALALLGAFKFDSEPFSSYDIGHLSGESNIGEEEAQKLAQWVFKPGNEAQIIIDESFFTHPDSKFIFSTLKRLKLSVVLAGGEKSEADINEVTNEPQELQSFDGSVIYIYKTKDEPTLKANDSWLTVAKVKDGDMINISAKDGFNQTLKVVRDNSIKGTVALLGQKDIKGYNFKLVKVEKV